MITTHFSPFSPRTRLLVIPVGRVFFCGTAAEARDGLFDGSATTGLVGGTALDADAGVDVLGRRSGHLGRRSGDLGRLAPL